jgi:hypothetical protein
MKKDFEKYYVEVIAYLSQRHFFGEPFVSKEKFKIQLDNLAKLTWASNSGQNPEEPNFFTTKFSGLGFSHRLDVKFLFVIDQNGELVMVRAAISMNGIERDYPGNRSSAENSLTLKQVEDILVDLHKKSTLKNVDRKHRLG